MRDRVDLVAAEHSCLHHSPVATLGPALCLELSHGETARVRLDRTKSIDLIVLREGRGGGDGESETETYTTSTLL